MVSAAERNNGEAYTALQPSVFAGKDPQEQALEFESD